MYVAQERDKNKNTSSPNAESFRGNRKTVLACMQKAEWETPTRSHGTFRSRSLAHSGREVETCAAANHHSYLPCSKGCLRWPTYELEFDLPASDRPSHSFVVWILDF